MKKKYYIPIGILIVLLCVRMILEPIVHKRLNKFLSTFSPVFSFTLADLDIHLIRGAYTFEGVTGKTKADNNQFVKIDKVDVSIAWRELFRGKVVTDIDVDGLDFSYTKNLKEAFAKVPKDESQSKDTLKDDATEVKDKLFPVKVERVDLMNASVTLDDYPSLEEGKKFRISKIDGRITNLTPAKEFPLSFFNLKGTILDSSVVKATGHLNTLAKPLQWDVDGELQNFDLTSANQFLKRKLPITFTKGKLDLYAEAISQKGKIEGYFKPFIKNLDVIKSKEVFKGPKHWLIEVITALSNLVLREKNSKSVATKIPFSSDANGFHIDSGEALSKAIQHGFQQQLSPGIEDKFELE